MRRRDPISGNPPPKKERKDFGKDRDSSAGLCIERSCDSKDSAEVGKVEEEVEMEVEAEGFSLISP